MVRLNLMDYKFFPYEKDLALKEAQSVFGSFPVAVGKGLEFGVSLDDDKLKKLTYFKSVTSEGSTFDTIQYLLENDSSRSATKKQNTRYGVHGVHEYKGKFNPQIVKSLINIFRQSDNQVILDPFCGSGTTLVESSLLGYRSVGIDLNPLAVFISRVKTSLLTYDIEKLQIDFENLKKTLKNTPSQIRSGQDERQEYLSKWFPPETFNAIEHVKHLSSAYRPISRDVILLLTSNILREYSLQEPSDLRIRRRVSPFPTEPFFSRLSRDLDAFEARYIHFMRFKPSGIAEATTHCLDVRSALDLQNTIKARFDLVVTSPPYATALPYIDTQRLSLVWLDLIGSHEIKRYDAILIGSRESRGVNDRTTEDMMKSNEDYIPNSLFNFCQDLSCKISSKDGFRKRAVPMLLFRYFIDMKHMFDNVLPLLKPGAPFLLIVGHNFTRLGGDRIDLNTPKYLSEIAHHSGYTVKEIIGLDTYQRYGMHSSNAISKESLVVLKSNDRIDAASSCLCDGKEQRSYQPTRAGMGT